MIITICHNRYLVSLTAAGGFFIAFPFQVIEKPFVLQRIKLDRNKNLTFLHSQPFIVLRNGASAYRIQIFRFDVNEAERYNLRQNATARDQKHLIRLRASFSELKPSRISEIK
ncbi:hypothetical protein GQX74_014704 [Glossina fuscipes]|nr:hypothetical protein GQX74_014704 [Glossina fuscipes]